MITVNKANPTPGEITSSLTGSTGDGAGLNLANNGYIDIAKNSATNFGTTDFSIEFVLNQTADNVSDSYIYFSHIFGNSRLVMWNDISANTIVARFTDSGGSNTDITLSYDMSADYGTPTHYVFAFDRSADLTLYKNGNSVASASISAASSINIGAGNGNVSRIGNATNYGALGTFYRFRAFNTLADAKLLFERADVPQTLTANLLFDLDLAFANPTQSLTVQDRKGNTDGTASSSTLVTQVQPVVQLNSTSARIGTSTLQPADGELMVDSVDVRNGNVRVIGGNQVQLLNAANDTNVDIINSGGTGVAQLGLRVAGSEKVTIGANGNVLVGAAALDANLGAKKMQLEGSASTDVGPEMLLHNPAQGGGAASLLTFGGKASGTEGYTAAIKATNTGTLSFGTSSASGGFSEPAADLTIDSSGNVTVDGGGYVKIGPADTQAELQLYRDDSTINAAGIAIGDINFGGADANNDNAARLRVKSDDAWTSTSSPTAFEFQTCPSGSESLATRLTIGSTGLCTFSNGITVSGGLTSLGDFSEVTISGGGITVTSSTHRIDTQNDDPSDQLSSISGGTDGSILVLQSVTSTRDVTVTHSNGTSPQNIHLAGAASFTLDTSNDVLVLIKYGSIWREVSRSDNS